MYSEEIEKLIKYAVIDGKVSSKERSILLRKAAELGIAKDEFEMVLDARIFEVNNQNKNVQKSFPGHQKQPVKSAKCPNCQAVIDSYSTTCNYCKHSVVGRVSNSSIQHLFILLTKAESKRRQSPGSFLSSLGSFYAKALTIGPNKIDREKMEIISSFPIPTTKADILEFMSLAYPKAKQAGNCLMRYADKNKLHNDFALVWKNKCRQIIMKAKFSMKDDPETLNEVLYYAKKLGID